jgi:hypothetical protein
LIKKKFDFPSIFQVLEFFLITVKNVGAILDIYANKNKLEEKKRKKEKKHLPITEQHSLPPPYHPLPQPPLLFLSICLSRAGE